MSNTLITCNIIAKEVLRILDNMLSFTSNANRDYQNEYTANQSRGYSPGATINIKRPPRYTYRTGRVITGGQATIETSVPLTLEQGGTEMEFTTFEKTLSLQQLESKFKAAAETIANQIDLAGLTVARNTTFHTANVSGTGLGTVNAIPNTQATALAALTESMAVLDYAGAPRNDRLLVTEPFMNAALVTGLQGLFNNTEMLGEQYKKGLLVDPLGMRFGMDQNVQVHTNGTQPSTGGTVNGAGQTGSTINVNTASITGNITVGSVITFAGVFAVNPQSRQSTGRLQQFVVTAPVAAAATSIQISPAITPTGAFQTVTASPANTAAITVLGAASATYRANVVYHPDAFTLATVPMEMPSANGNGVVDQSQVTHKGISLKVVEAYDVLQDKNITRLDVLFGWAATYPELSCKLVA